MERPDHVSAEDWELLGGSPPAKRKRRNRPKIPCPHLKGDGSSCDAFVMKGSDRCFTHSGMNNPKVRQKRQEERAIAEMMKDPVVARLISVGESGEELTDPLAVLRKSAASMQRVVQFYTEQDGDDPNGERFDKALLMLDRLERLCVTLVKIGQTDRALNAAEVRNLPAWVALEDAIAKALEQHPEARSAVFAALAGVAPQPEPMPGPIVVKGELA